MIGSVKIWLDDIRPAPSGFALAKTAEEAIEMLSRGDVSYVSLDHDLGEGKSGYDVAKWIEEQAFRGNLPRLEWDVHSANPVGASNISRALRRADDFWRQGTDKSGSFNMGRKNAAQVGSDHLAFMDKVRSWSRNAREHGKRAAMANVMGHSGITMEEASLFYDNVRDALSECGIVVNLDSSSLMGFISGHARLNNPSLSEGFNASRKSMEKALLRMGCGNLKPVVALITSMRQGDRRSGPCSLVLGGFDDGIVLLAGGHERLVSPSREDFSPDPSSIIYDMSDMADCRAASAICALPMSVLAGGPARAMEELMELSKDYGKCEALIFGEVSPRNVSGITVRGEDDARTLRRLLDKMDRIVPVTILDDANVILPRQEDDDAPMPKQSRVTCLHFSPGDRVAMKPTASNPRATGTILDASDGVVAIQWDDSTRATFDMTEALARLMDAPSDRPRPEGMITYSLPGMDAGSVAALSSVGIDPVTLYGAASHAAPASTMSDGWVDLMIRMLGEMGIGAKKTNGYARSRHGKLAFMPREWVEARLAPGTRLVIDVTDGKLLMRAGDSADDYVLPLRHENHVIE